MVSRSRFEELAIPHRNSAFNLAYWILQSREDAEDAVQDAFVRAFRAFDRLSNTMDTDFCIEALEEALAKYGKPEIFNSDQGSQFTSPRFTGVLKEAGVKISMDGKGRWMDNVFIERLWRSLKYECVYLHEFETGTQARMGIGMWMKFYGTQRPHSAHAGLTPDEVYAGAARFSTDAAQKKKKQQQQKLAA